MGLCGSAPSAPDPVVTANAQGTVNKDTAITQANLNRIDQVSPYGSSTYSIKGYNSDGTPQYVQTNSLSPQLQAMLDSQLQQDQSLTGLGSTLIDQAKTNSGTPLTASGTMPLIGGMSPDQFNNWTNAFKTTAGPIALGNTATAGPSAQYGGAGASAGSANASQASGWDIQKALQGAGDLQGQFNSARDAALQSQMGYLQPQFDQQSQQAADQLRQQGITQQSNPAAYQHAMDQLNRDQTFQRQQAYDSSFQTGLASANQLFNQSLQAGQFANSAQQQGFDQSAWNAGQQNQVGMANAANATQAGIASSNNATQAGIASMQAANQMGMFNAEQANNMNLSNAGMVNQQNQFNTQANNAAQAAVMQGYQSNAALQNATSGQHLQQLFALRNQPLNELASLRGMTPISSPQFGSTPQVQMQSPDLMGAINNQYQSNLASYNNQQSGTMGAIGTVATLAAMFF